MPGNKMNTRNKKIIGERIKNFRKNFLKMTQKEFTELVDMSQANLARIESGSLFPNFELISYLHNEFNMNLHWLINGEGNKILKNSELKQDSVDLRDLYPGLPNDPRIDELLSALQIDVIYHKIISDFIIYKKRYQDYMEAYYNEKEVANESP